MDLGNMTPEEIEKLLVKLRLYLNDKEGSKFSDDELKMLLEEAGCLYCAVSEGWSLIATQIDVGGTKKYSIGMETYEKSGLNDQIKAALNNAEYFKGKCACESSINQGGSFILRADTRL